jgi:uncharacterized repeat protein (TIGR01451 family)
VFAVNNGNGGSWNGDVTGVAFVDGSHAGLTFNVDSGYKVTALCVKTSSGLNVPGDYTLKPSSFPIVGPATVTITATDAAGPPGIIHVGFTIEPMPPPPKPVLPLLACVEAGSGGYVAHFGYDNPNGSTQHIAVGADNGFSPAPANRGQPTDFHSGRQVDAFQVPFSGGSLRWTLQGANVEASTSATKCQGTLRVDKSLDPPDDSGRFDLRIDGKTLAQAVGNNGTTGDVAVTTGAHTVSEVAAGRTNLSDYATTIVCRDGRGNGATVAQGSGTSLTVTVGKQQAVACVIANSHQQQPPAPGVDLAITKTASERSVALGDTVVWTVTVTNKGPGTATNVVVTDHLPAGIQLVSGSLVVPSGVTCTGPVCKVASIAPGASGSGSFKTTAIAVGAQTDIVDVKADQPDANPSDNVASALVQVTAPPTPIRVEPVLECVEKRPSGGLRAHFGYLNPGSATVVVPKGPQNAFSPPPDDRGQPDQFEPGRAVDVVQVDQASGSLTWKIGSQSATASSSSPACLGTLRIDKALSPASDSGRFDLLIDRSVAGTGANVSDRGTTGDVRVVATPTGTLHLVGEEGTGATSLGNYDTTIVCRGRGGTGPPLAKGSSTEVAVPVTNGDSVVCAVSNTRHSTQPPSPTPPSPTPSSPPPPTPTPQADLSVAKNDRPNNVSIGERATATVTVTNHGPDAATNVVLSARIPPGAVLLSVKVSQGTCARGSCRLGTIPAGASVTITAVARLVIAGAAVDVVGVSAAEADPDTTNNVASDLVRVVALTPPVSGRKPQRRPVCASLSLDRRTATVGTILRLHAHLRTAGGTPIAGLLVRAHGAGIDVIRRSDRSGVAHFTLRPAHPGILVVRGRGPRCGDRIGVSSRPSLPITG